MASLNYWTEEQESETTPIDDVMGDIRGELVHRVAESDRDGHCEIFDALKDE